MQSGPWLLRRMGLRGKPLRTPSRMCLVFCSSSTMALMNTGCLMCCSSSAQSPLNECTEPCCTIICMARLAELLVPAAFRNCRTRWEVSSHSCARTCTNKVPGVELDVLLDAGDNSSDTHLDCKDKHTVAMFSAATGLPRTVGLHATNICNVAISSSESLALSTAMDRGIETLALVTQTNNAFLPKSSSFCCVSKVHLSRFVTLHDRA
jgi:hypothetical protein